MTDYATAPVTGSVYGDDGGLDELMVDAWMGVDFTLPPDLNWDDQQMLEMCPRGLFLVFEQGRNATPCVFALKSEPTVDLAGAEFTLHYLPEDPNGDEFPQRLRDWYRPVADLIDRLAADTGRPVRQRSTEVMTLFIQQIAEHCIVRAQEVDEDGDLIGLDRDVAADLPAAWAAKVAEVLP